MKEANSLRSKLNCLNKTNNELFQKRERERGSERVFKKVVAGNST